MSILSRYIVQTFLRFLVVILAIMVSLYGLIEFIEKVDDFIEHGAGVVAYLKYPIYNLPLMLSMTLPLAILLGAFATIASLSRSGQLTAMFSGGASFARVTRPLFLCALACALLLLPANLWLVPWSVSEAEYLRQTEIKGKLPVDLQARNLIFRDGDRIISVGRSFPDRGEIVGVSIITFNDRFMPIRRVEAARARHLEAGRWRFEEARIMEFSSATQAITRFEKPGSVVLDLQRHPEQMLQLWYEPEQMTWPRLQAFIGKLEAEGYAPHRYRVEGQMRISRAAAPLIMVLLGVPFAVRRGREVSFSLGVILSLGIFLLYFLLNAVFAAAGSAALLPPLVAAWAANLLMTLVGGWLFLQRRD